jgi:UDP-3-O-[3-hydroxymyristoyl] glucosamine N-acyltransferase
VIEKEALIGARSILHSLIHIGADCEIGEDCEIHPHTTIGADGFGFVPDAQNLNHKVPQLGKVILEDRVEIGASCTIDRATLGETLIGAGCKFDNLIHIAHNCVIGKNALLAGGFAVAGSTHIGDNFKAGGAASVADHVHICDNVTIGGYSGVTKDITEPGAYTGYPLQPWREGLRTLASLPNVPEMRRELAELRKSLTK